jgi:hypothetical protein
VPSFTKSCLDFPSGVGMLVRMPPLTPALVSPRAGNRLLQAFNNPDRAVDILLQGGPPDQFPADAMPSTVGAEAGSVSASSGPAPAPSDSGSARVATGGLTHGDGNGVEAGNGDANTAGGDGGASGHRGDGGTADVVTAAADAAAAAGEGQRREGEGPLDFLRRLPQFTLMRHSIQLQPRLLPQLLQQLGRSNPSLLALINEHQSDFVRLVNEPVCLLSLSASLPACLPVCLIPAAFGSVDDSHEVGLCQVSEEDLSESLRQSQQHEAQMPPPNTVQV